MGRVPLVVLDTSVLVAAIRSRRGASFQILQRVGTGLLEIAVSVPIVLEYEDAMLRNRGALSQRDISDILDYVCGVARRQDIFFLWRPLLRDPGDDMVAEAAVAAGAESIITHNVRDFAGLERFGIDVLTPGEFLARTRGTRK